MDPVSARLPRVLVALAEHFRSESEAHVHRDVHDMRNVSDNEVLPVVLAVGGELLGKVELVLVVDHLGLDPDVPGLGRDGATVPGVDGGVFERSTDDDISSRNGNDNVGPGWRRVF